MSWMSASRVGGSPSIALPFWVKSCFLASLTCCWLLVRSYSNTTNHSSCPKHSSMVCRVGVENKAQNAEVTSPYAFLVSNLTSNKDINHRMQHIWSGRSPLTISWAARNAKFLPTPKATHSSLMLRCWAAGIARTTTSVSTVQIDTLLCPWCKATSKWRSKRVSACACVHGARLETSCWFVQSMTTWWMVRTSLVVLMPGSVLDYSTFLLTPFPLLIRVSAFQAFRHMLIPGNV